MLLQLIKKLIACPSISPNDFGVIPIVIEALNKWGFQSNIISFGDGNDKVDNLYAKLGDKETNICFVGHTDVVPPGSGWLYNPFECFETKDGTLYGRGMVDMKGAIAAFIEAVNQISIQMLITHP